MMNLNERYLVDNQGNRLGVFLDMQDYQKLLNILEKLESLSINNEIALTKDINAKSSLSELLECVATEKERMTLTYKRKMFIAAVPIDDVDVIKHLQSNIDGYTHNQLEPLCIEQDLEDFLERQIAVKTCLTLTYRKQVFLISIPITDVDVIQRLEDCIDNADADDALNEEGESLTSGQVDKILGW